MRIYNDPIEAIKEVQRDIFEMGIRYQSETVQDQVTVDDKAFETMEIFGYSYMIKNWTDKELHEFLLFNENNVKWAFAEEQERLSLIPSNPGSAWRKNEKLWNQFIRKGFFAYSYSERWQEQIKYIIRELHIFPNTRQAIMTMYDKHQDMMNWGGLDRVPCSISYQFLFREGKLNVIYYERSCDFIKFFATDVYLTIRLLEYVANAIGAEVGSFIHFLGSLHLFAGDVEGRDIF